MTTLAIENSTDHGSLAVAVDGRLVHAAQFRGSSELSLAVAAAFRKAPSPDRIVVGTGPGSYTGLRVAVATALGLQVALGCELAGCSSVLGFVEDRYAVIGNARRGSFFFAVIRSRRVVDGPRLVPAGEVVALAQAVSPAPCFAVTPVPEGVHAQVRYPEAAPLLGCSASWSGSVEPLYLKEPHVTRSA